ncbi:MAG: DUF2259 domain-containing protein [Termitinemataceae bacterium]|nr:MAG: DUF2259 domain-containing protein [Termitinemataceae bacterium]
MLVTVSEINLPVANERQLKLIFVFLFVAIIDLWAGDVASFSDLGFSDNGKIYMFGQYGVDENTLNPWADLFIIDVVSNDFVENGRFSYKHNEKIDPGQDGQGALIRLLSKNSANLKKFQPTFMKQGIPLFVSLKNGHNPNGEIVDFRDFDYGLFYTATLVPATFGSGKNIKSSFYILLDIIGRNGSKHTFRIGNPNIKREDVTSYTIKKVMINEERTSMIFVVEMTVGKGSSQNIRYMVEALRLN